MTRALALVVAAAALAGCGGDRGQTAVPGADPARGKALIVEYGCGGCHTISGITYANSRVGPVLKQFPRNPYIAGKLPNTIDNAVRWIQNPQAIVPGNLMPDLGVSAEEARDIVAYVYSQ